MGYRVVTLEPFPDSPAGQVADEQIVAAYDDLRAIGELGARSDVVTYEFENIPLESVQAPRSRPAARVDPSAARLAHHPRALARKDVRARVRDPDRAPSRRRAIADELDAALREHRVSGRAQDDAAAATTARASGSCAARPTPKTALAQAQGPRADLRSSSIAVRARALDHRDARRARRDRHLPGRGERARSRRARDDDRPGARIADASRDARARARARRSRAKLGIVGTYCVEFFRGRRPLLVNEIAPRVHNSGHYSLDATQISQYEKHVRAICGLPLVEPRLFAPAVMVNILGTGEGDRLDGDRRDLARSRRQAAHVRQGACRRCAARWGTSRCSGRRSTTRSPARSAPARCFDGWTSG